MKGLIDSIGNPSMARCSRLFGGHDWLQRGRRTIKSEAFSGFDPETMRMRSVEVSLYVLRFECRICRARAVVNTRDPDVLWQLGVEIPKSGDGEEVLR